MSAFDDLFGALKDKIPTHWLIVPPHPSLAHSRSDPTTDKSAASLDVRVGHLSDPDKFPGLAHFLEHMLFMGTEKYPDENEYNTFLSSHGGGSNAYTDTEDTNYYFDVLADHFEGAIDRFAQFFVSPLFTPSATERELKAVDSENSKNKQNDFWRSFQLMKSLAREDHPFHKFGTGNSDTIKDCEETRESVRDALLKFHKAFYSADVMKLVMVGKEVRMVKRCKSILRRSEVITFNVQRTSLPT